MMIFRRQLAVLLFAAVAALETTPAAARGPLATDQQTISALDLDTPGLEVAKAALQSNDFEAAKRAYLEFRRTASPARFTVDPVQKPKAAVESSDAIGDEIVRHFIRNSYGFNPQSGDMGQPFDWKSNPVSHSSPDFTFEWTYCIISRLGFWKDLANAYWKTLDEKYAKTWVDQLLDFVHKNPADDQPPTGSLWRTLDASERMYDAWPYCYAHFLNSPAFTPEAHWIYLRSLLDHVKILKAGLDAPGRTGNWVVSECYGLYAIGALFPELKEASTWRQIAVDRMSKELAYCVPPDGFEAELTPNYHYFTLSSFTGPMELAKLNNLPIPREFHDTILSMYRAPVLVMDQRGYDVPTNDSSLHNSAQQARIGVRLLGSDPLLDWAASYGSRGTPPPASTMLPYAGFYAMRGGWNTKDTFLFFRAGPTGIAHEHEDMLEVTLRAWNKSLLFEQGTYQYDQSEWRRFDLSTSSHSTVIVDGNGQHRGRSTAPVTQPVANPWITTPLFDFTSGIYDKGYQKSAHDLNKIGSGVSYVGPLDRSVCHTRRVVFLKPYYALILDSLDGSGMHTFDSLYYMDSPSAEIDPGSGAAFSHNQGDVQLGLFPLEEEHLLTDIVQGQMEPMLGWFVGAHRPTPTVRFRKEQEAPARFATFLYPYFGKHPHFHAESIAAGEGVWGEKIQTALEDAVIALSSDNSMRAISIDGMAAHAAGIISRRLPNGDSFIGGWEITHFADHDCEFVTASPSALVWEKQGDGLLIYNAGDMPIDWTISRPFKHAATLVPRQWNSISAYTAVQTSTPPLFEPIPIVYPETSYGDYINDVSKASQSTSFDAIHIPANQFILPPNAELKPKVGVDHRVVDGWKNFYADLQAEVRVPADGWYRAKLRYCCADRPMLSLLLNNAFPFKQAHDWFLPSTFGDPPSNGYSDRTSDWKETTLGDGETLDGWKLWLLKGENTITLRNGDGRIIVDWLDLEPVAAH